MAWKYVLVGIGMSIAVIAYWLYSPLPDGYPFSCAIQLQMVFACGKVVDLVVSTVLLAVCALALESSHYIRIHLINEVDIKSSDLLTWLASEGASNLKKYFC